MEGAGRIPVRPRSYSQFVCAAALQAGGFGLAPHRRPSRHRRARPPVICRGMIRSQPPHGRLHCGMASAQGIARELAAGQAAAWNQHAMHASAGLLHDNAAFVNASGRYLRGPRMT